MSHSHGMPIVSIYKTVAFTLEDLQQDIARYQLYLLYKTGIPAGLSFLVRQWRRLLAYWPDVFFLPVLLHIVAWLMLIEGVANLGLRFGIGRGLATGLLFYHGISIAILVVRLLPGSPSQRTTRF